jgi:hypothetical protein
MPIPKKKRIKKKEDERNSFTKNRIIVHEDYLEVITYTHQSKENGTFLVDLDMLEFIKTHKCRKASAGYILFGNSNALLHRFITKAKKGEKVDHINRNRSDNRKSNLRICTDLENSRNRDKDKKDRSSSYKGTFYVKKNEGWGCGVWVLGKWIGFGAYSTELEAAYIYNINVGKYFGEFSVYNKIPQEDINRLKKMKIETLQEKRRSYSKYPNVTYNVCKKCWVWRKMIKGKLYNKQYFKTAESAYKAFLKFEEELKICQ